MCRWSLAHVSYSLLHRLHLQSRDPGCWRKWASSSFLVPTSTPHWQQWNSLSRVGVCDSLSSHPSGISVFITTVAWWVKLFTESAILSQVCNLKYQTTAYFIWGERENVLFNDALNTFYLWLYGIIYISWSASDIRIMISIWYMKEGRKEMFYLMMHSPHFIYGYMASDIWLSTILIVRKETRCRHIGYSYRLTARVLLYAPSHRQDSTYHGLCYTSRGALAGTRNSSMGPSHEGSIRQPIAPWANALTTELHLAPSIKRTWRYEV